MAQLDPYVWIVAVGGIACFMQGFGIGANDVANNFGTALGAKAMKLWAAIIIAAIFELVGCVAFGSSVTDAVRSKILNIDSYEQSVDVFMYGNLCALLCAATLLIAASQFGLPISTTHSIVGGLVGFGIAADISTVDWFEVGMIIMSWVVSPLASAVVSGLVFVAVRHFIMRRPDPVKAGYRSLWLLVFIVNVVFVFFFVFKSSMTLNTSCPMDDGSGGVVVGSPCKVSAWTTGNPGLASGICIGIAAGLSLIMAPLAYWLARRGMKKFDAAEEKETADLETTVSSNFKVAVGGTEEADRTASGPAQGKWVDEGRLSEKVAEKPGDAPFCSNAWWRKKWYAAPWFQDICADALNEDATAAKIHEQHEDFGERPEHFFKFLQVVTASVQCVVHGSNDVANAAAPFATIYACFSNGYLSSTVDTPVWILFLAGSAIAVGLALFGYKVIKSVGVKITKITPCRAFSIEIGAAAVILLASSLGIPVSTTQCTLGSAVGVGLLDKVEGYTHKWYECGFLNSSRINWKLVAKIGSSWAISLILVMAATAASFAFGAYGPTLQHSYYDLKAPWPEPPEETEFL